MKYIRNIYIYSNEMKTKFQNLFYWNIFQEIRDKNTYKIVPYNNDYWKF